MSPPHRRLPSRSGFVPALIAGLIALAVATPAQAIRYPRLAMPGAIHGNGVPYLDSLGALNTQVIDAASRFEEVIVDASPISEYHPEIIAALRARNPDLKAIAYVLGEDIWEVNAQDSLHHFPTRYNHMIRDLGGFLYDRRGNHYRPNCVNIAKRDANGRYVVAEAIANLLHDAVVGTGLWDGMFVDVYCDEISWSQAPTESIDVSRTGYADLASLDVGWRAGSDTLASRLRALCGPDFLLVGNCAIGSKYGWFNGWTRENFPFQGGGSWYTNMFWDPGGYFADEKHFRQPPRNHIFTPQTGAQIYDANTRRRVRFALGSAALGEGLAIFGPDDRGPRNPVHELWWYDEYAVDVASGNAMTDRAHTGWLGEALGAPYQMVWVGTNPDASSNPGFEADVTSGWSFGRFGPVSATISRDTTAAPDGRASARIDVATPGVNPWDVNLATTGMLPLFSGATYAATFWARASAPVTFPVTATMPTGGAAAARDVTLGTTWQRYQVILQPGVSSNCVLEFFLGHVTGTVWFDDVHFQRDATNLWRRDFQNGVVLVNPSDLSLSAPMGASDRRIRGVVDPVVNDGSTVATATVGASDALFLIGTVSDTIPPATVRDAHVVP